MTERTTGLFDAAERNLVQVHSFFTRIDARVSAIFAITSGQIAVVTLNITFENILSSAVFVFLVLYLICAFGALFNLYWCTYPDLIGGEKSLIFFGEIAKQAEVEFVKDYMEADLETLRHDVVRQIWRNSVIVKKKYEFLRVATLCTGISVVPWTILLACLSANAGKLAIGG